MAAQRGNQLIQDMCRRPEAIARLNADPERVFAEFGLTEEERAALRQCDPMSMGRVGIHPILQMHYIMARNPQVMERMSIQEYDGLVEED